LQALKDTVQKNKRLPCNLSAINDQLRKNNADWRVGDTNYSRFGDLARAMEKEGYMELTTDKDSLCVGSSKFYEPPSPSRSRSRSRSVGRADDTAGEGVGEKADAGGEKKEEGEHVEESTAADAEEAAGDKEAAAGVPATEDKTTDPAGEGTGADGEKREADAKDEEKEEGEQSNDEEARPPRTAVGGKGEGGNNGGGEGGDDDDDDDTERPARPPREPREPRYADPADAPVQPDEAIAWFLEALKEVLLRKRLPVNVSCVRARPPSPLALPPRPLPAHPEQKRCSSLLRGL
jgi:hypothetical protein